MTASSTSTSYLDRFSTLVGDVMSNGISGELLQDPNIGMIELPEDKGLDDVIDCFRDVLSAFYPDIVKFYSIQLSE